MAEQLIIKASLDITGTSNIIAQQLIQQVTPNVNNKKPLKIIGSLNITQTQQEIERQLNSITGLKINNIPLNITGNVSTTASQLNASLGQIAQNAQSANSALGNFDVSAISKMSFALKEIGDGSKIVDQQKALEQIKNTFTSLGQVSVNWTQNFSGGIDGFTAKVVSAEGEVRNLKYSLTNMTGAEGIFKYSGGSGTDSGIAKLVQDIENAKAKYTNLLNTFKSSNSGILSGLTTPLADVQNKINGLGNTNSIDQLKNSFEMLKSETAQITKYLDTTNSSFNKITNAVNKYQDMGKSISLLSAEFDKLKSKPTELSQRIDNASKKLASLQQIENSMGRNSTWSQAYQGVNRYISQIANDLKLVQKEQQADNSLVNQSKKYYGDIANNLRLIQSLKSKMPTAGEAESKELQRQITNAQKRIQYEEHQIKKKNLYNEALFREVNALRNVQGEQSKLNISGQVDTATNKLKTLEEQWKKQGILVGEFKDKVEALKAQLSGIKDVNGLNSFNSQLTGLSGTGKNLSLTQSGKEKEVNALLDKQKASLSEIQRLRTQIVQEQGKSNNQSKVAELNRQLTAEQQIYKTIQQEVSQYGNLINNEQRRATLKGLTAEAENRIKLIQAGQVDRSSVNTANQTASTAQLNSQLALLQTRLDAAKSRFATFQQSLNPKAMSQYSSEIQNVSTSLQRVQQALSGKNLNQATSAFKQAQAEAGKFKAQMQEMGNVGKTIFGKLSQNVKQFANYLLSATTIMLPIRMFREAIETMKEVDTLLTEISKTSTITTSNLKKLGLEAYDSANKYGATVQGYLKAMQEMSRAGFDEGQAKQLSELSILAQSAGDMTSDLANEYLIATNFAYGYGGSVEKLNAVLDAQNQINKKVCLIGNFQGYSLLLSGKRWRHSIPRISRHNLFITNVFESVTSKSSYSNICCTQTSIVIDYSTKCIVA